MSIKVNVNPVGQRASFLMQVSVGGQPPTPQRIHGVVRGVSAHSIYIEWWDIEQQTYYRRAFPWQPSQAEHGLEIYW